MPRIIDNITPPTLNEVLRQTLERSKSADYCVGYFNLRGWKHVDEFVERWQGGPGSQCRLLIGMQPSADAEARALLSLTGDDSIDQSQALRLKVKIAEGFKQQLTFGAPTNGDESALRRLASQLRSKKLVVKLHLRHTLHAKLYLHHTSNPDLPSTGFLGSSNLTLAGLSKQGELNVDVLDHDACRKLQTWFDERWNDRFCIDISDELAEIIEKSWASPQPIPPYHLYLKMAYQLSQDARAGVDEFRLPAEFGNTLFDFQVNAVQMAAKFVNTRGGVMIGDVVGLGKTLMATAVARVLEDDQGLETLVICPRNLVSMWESYAHKYRLRAEVVSLSMVERLLPELRRYRLVVIDESQNLRNREGKRYAAILDYLTRNGCRCILLSATPYNKSFEDLGSQLALIVDREQRLGVRPDALIRSLGGDSEFFRRHQFAPDTLAAFEQSPIPDDWRELMRRYMVRRTRTFIRTTYAKRDAESGRDYLRLSDGTRSYFPDRTPRTLHVASDGPNDQYSLLYSPLVVTAIEDLALPRYGLGEYVDGTAQALATPAEANILQDLGRAGKRLIGFCRTNLFKRLESSGPSFIQSVERHILRNFVYIHALEERLELPIGPQDAAFLEEGINDEDSDLPSDDGTPEPAADYRGIRTESDFRLRATEIYESYRTSQSRRFRWIRPSLFAPDLEKALRRDTKAMLEILEQFGEWNPARDTKLDELTKLVSTTHSKQKVLVFTQFADTLKYVVRELEKRGVSGVEGVTGQSKDPSAVARRFSPGSNDYSVKDPSDEIRVLVATDVLSEGQNLQDCSIVVNYDLPWAIIRLIQRAGRVDRIGQKATEILCYTFLPADGVESLIQLRSRVSHRLKENSEVVGSDEVFFEEQEGLPLWDIYHERAGVFDDTSDTEVDLTSEAFHIWHSAIQADPSLERIVRDLPDVAFSAMANENSTAKPDGVLLYLQTTEGNDTMTSQQLEIYRNLKTLVHNDMISLPDDMTLIRELKIKNGKIDHDIAGKDYADAVAAVVWAASGEGETDVQRLVRETMGSRRGAHVTLGGGCRRHRSPQVSRKWKVRFWGPAQGRYRYST